MVVVLDFLFVFGGYNFGILNSVEYYDIGFELWKQVGEFQFGVDGSFVVVIDDKVYIVGGCMSFIEEFVGIQCFDIKIYMCLLIVNFCMFLKFISVIKFLDLVCIVCDNGEVIFFSVREGYCVI